MAILVVCVVTFLASILTLFSGFGLGTILMPVVAIFLPVPIAIAVTAIVHFLNKIFKVAVMWKHIHFPTLIRFGVPALIAAAPGALLLSYIGMMETSNVIILGKELHLAPVKVVAGTLLIFFATAEIVPFLRNKIFSKFGLIGGGLLSGFFGGLTGHQGAFRSAFLVQENFSEHEFVATNGAVAAMVDAVRLIVYGLTFNVVAISENIELVLAAVIASYAGVSLGARLVKKITIKFIQKLVAAMMYILGILLVLGLV